jgi:hypothetical protein
VQFDIQTAALFVQIQQKSQIFRLALSEKETILCVWVPQWGLQKCINNKTTLHASIIAHESEDRENSRQSSIVEEVAVVQVVLVTKIHQAENHLLAAANTGVEEAVQMRGIDAQFPTKSIVIAGTLHFHEFHHFFSAQTWFHCHSPLLPLCAAFRARQNA